MELHQRIVSFFHVFRRSLLILAAALCTTTVVLYFWSPVLLTLLQSHLHQELAFYSIAEPFLAHAKLAFFSSVFILMPLILYSIWTALAQPFNISNRSRIIFTASTSTLFYAGSTFCFMVTLPFGIDFLLGFGSDTLQPIISINKFVGFVSLFIVAFGVIFELPVFMVFSATTGLCPRRVFEKNRRYAILIISILAALLTPTPDVVNMMLMGGPLYLLYEAGIIILKIMGLE